MLAIKGKGSGSYSYILFPYLLKYDRKLTFTGLEMRIEIEM